MPKKRYPFLMRHKQALVEGIGWKIYDFISECNSYVYRDTKAKKYTPVSIEKIKKCMDSVLAFLPSEYNGVSEYSKCRKACKQPLNRFFIATILLWQVYNKIELNDEESIYSREKRWYLKLKKEEAPTGWVFQASSSISVADKDLNKVLRENEEERKKVLEQYQQYRETFGR